MFRQTGQVLADIRGVMSDEVLPQCNAVAPNADAVAIDSTERSLIAYELDQTHDFELVVAPPGRDWMSATDQRFANRCLPLLMANQAGWLVFSKARFRVKWDGGSGVESVEINCDNPNSAYRPTSHFGYGIVTWNLPFLFRTPPGYDLLVRGPANWVQCGMAPLEGLVETDWSPTTFTVKLEGHAPTCLGNAGSWRSFMHVGAAAARRAR